MEAMAGMANPFLGVRISPELDRAIAARMKETGQTKSDIVVDALKTYLGIMPYQARLEALEQRLASLEAVVTRLDEPVHHPQSPSSHSVPSHQPHFSHQPEEHSESRHNSE